MGLPWFQLSHYAEFNLTNNLRVSHILQFISVLLLSLSFATGKLYRSLLLDTFFSIEAIFENILISTNSSHLCVSVAKKYSFFGTFGVLCFLETAVLRFAHLHCYRWLFIYCTDQSGFANRVESFCQKKLKRTSNKSQAINGVTCYRVIRSGNQAFLSASFSFSSKKVKKASRTTLSGSKITETKTHVCP